MPTVRAKATAVPSAKATLHATTTQIGKGKQARRDVPQSVTVVTEKLMDKRNLDTLKEALKNIVVVSLQAAEGGEEDIRLRGFSLQSAGDIFIGGMRDPAFYERNSFNWNRLELLRGPASMLFGRGSTGAAVNPVGKQPGLLTQGQVTATLGAGSYLRATGDVNLVTGQDATLRLNTMLTEADGHDVGIDKRGIAPTRRWGIGMRDEFSPGLVHLRNRNGIHHGLPWLTPGAAQVGDDPWPTDPRNYYGAASDINATGTDQFNASHIRRFDGGAELKTRLRVARCSRDQRDPLRRHRPCHRGPPAAHHGRHLRRRHRADAREAQVGLFAARTSCHVFAFNPLRVLLAALAYVLIERLRALALQGTELANAQINTRRIRLYFASNWPSASIFVQAMHALGVTQRTSSSAWPAR